MALAIHLALFNLLCYNLTLYREFAAMTGFSVICCMFIILAGVAFIADIFDCSEGDNVKAVKYSVGILATVALCVAVILGYFP
jgi:hypothetical protein